MNRSTYEPKFEIRQDFENIIAAEHATYRVWFQLDPHTGWVDDNQAGTADEADARMKLLKTVFA